MEQFKLWRWVRGPFVVPEGTHTCSDWEIVDIDRAGCRVCGACHCCANGRCNLITSEGWQICTVTGFCVKGLVFCNEEFVDTIAYAPGSSAAREIIFPWQCQVEGWVEEMIWSQTSRSALTQELQHRQTKTNAVFTRLTRNFKLRHKPINIMELYTLTAQIVNLCRMPIQLTDDEAHAMATECSNAMNKFLYLFFTVSTLPVTKHKGFVVGLLYLMRYGVVLWDSVVIVPKIERLCSCLPSENLLNSLFKLSTKVITHSENLIKQGLGKLSRAKLLDMGF